jgi:AcrR family transcriptional regulator
MPRRKPASAEPKAPPRKDVILAEAALLFAQKGVAATTVREIADASGILAGSLYHWFESKEEMVDELLGEAMEDLERWHREAAPPDLDPRARLHGLVRAALRTISSHPSACTLYLRDYAYLAMMPRFAYLAEAGATLHDLWVETLKDGAASGEFRSDVDPEVAYRYLSFPLWLSVGWYRTCGLTLDELEEQFLSLVLDGVLPRDAQPPTPE